jgi:hypothetical protein
MGVKYLFVLFVFFCFSQSLHADELVEGYTHKEALRLGEQMYRDGILPSGEPMEALVMGDIPFDGRMFTCDDCHQRSGLGSEEGTVITWPTNGKELFAPRRRTGAYRPPDAGEEKTGRRDVPENYQVEDARPAYTDRSLARLLRVGTDPSGRKLDPIMPKYRLSRKDQAILTYYLKHLSTTYSPGVDDTTILFATVIAGEVEESKKTAMLSVLQAHIDAHNSQSRQESKRAKSGPFYKTEKHKAYRSLNLSVWQLQGPESTWREQLEKYYADQPVFAILGGIAEGGWQKVHDFSEAHKIPTIFPITDRPKISDTDWYTLYYSKGLYQEGETVAKYVRSQFGVAGGVKLMQLYRNDDVEAKTIARGFSATWKKMGGTGVTELPVDGSVVLAEEQRTDVFAGDVPVVLLAWLKGTDTEMFAAIDKNRSSGTTVFASATLLAGDFSALPADLRGDALLTYPYSLPGSEKRSRFSVERWHIARNIPLTDFTLQAKMYFLGWMLPGAIKHLRSEFYRDYFLEGFDMMLDQDYSIAVYPRLTFGAGERYASKGCYIVRLNPADDTVMEQVSDWVTY